MLIKNSTWTLLLPTFWIFDVPFISKTYLLAYWRKLLSLFYILVFILNILMVYIYLQYCIRAFWILNLCSLPVNFMLSHVFFVIHSFYFLSVWRIPFSISCRTVLVKIYFPTVCQGIVLSRLHFRRIVSLDTVFLDDSLSTTYTTIWACKVFAKDSVVRQIGTSLYVVFSFSISLTLCLSFSFPFFFCFFFQP